jgi:pathogenesis-related protein 1
MVKLKIILFSVTLLICVTVPAVSFSSEQEQQDMVNSHNKWRSSVKTAPVTWSNDLASSAQNYADTLRDKQHCQMVHSHTKDVGENLFWASPVSYSNSTSALQPVTATQVVDSWGAESKDYNYQINTCKKGKMCGHYTQVVWRDTTQVGCGKAVCSDNSQVWGCRQYSPAGNYVGKKPY